MEPSFSEKINRVKRKRREMHAPNLASNKWKRGNGLCPCVYFAYDKIKETKKQNKRSCVQWGHDLCQWMNLLSLSLSSFSYLIYSILHFFYIYYLLFLFYYKINKSYNIYFVLLDLIYILGGR